MSSLQRIEGMFERDSSRANARREHPVRASVPEIQGPPPPPGELGPYAELGTFELEPSGTDVHWQRIQARFVDDPRGAIAEAEHLVETLLHEVLDGFRSQRELLEQRAASGSISTEELRIALHRYRVLAARLSDATNGAMTTAARG